jgi:hypothetical protein
MVMSPVGLGRKNDCAGEDRQQFTSYSVSRGVCVCVSAEGVISSNQPPPLVEEEASFQNI